MQSALLAWSEFPSFRASPPAPRAYRSAARVLLDLRAQDAATFRHVRDTARLTVAIARDLGLCSDDREHLANAALLHDLGKLFVEPALLRTSEILNEGELEAVQAHAAKGHAYALRIPEFHSVAGVIRHHHERWDGLGYPDGLEGSATPWDARIVAVADATEAMASGRSYRPPRPPAETIMEVRRCAGTQFDPWVARAASEGAHTRRALLDLEANACNDDS